ncbi:MAG: mechanosensitive ion channel family protein [Bacilli bacterium]|nr:mechanosensitive ion channel family protein [Bacilli bacterium]MBN2696510.1 mechanosensitive ion channel family protein [Bacilli bacterium]
MYYTLALPIWADITLTAALAAIILALFIIQRKWTIDHQEAIKNWQVWLIYLFDLVFFIGAILLSMFLWEFDFSLVTTDIVANLETFLLEKIGAIVGSIVAIFIALAILKVTKLALFHVGKKEGPLQKRKKTIAKVTQSIIKYVVGIVTILAMLAMWGVNVLPALAGLGMLGLVIGLGAQKFINDLISGFFIIFEHHFDVGDIIEVAGFKGEVTDIGLKTTRIRSWRGEVKILANGDITNLTNYSRNPSIAIIDFGIAYQEDVDKTTELLKAELPKLRGVLPEMLEDPQVLGVMSLADSSVNIRVICKTMTEKHYGVERTIRQKIKELLDENNIEIPFPQVVVRQVKTE